MWTFLVKWLETAGVVLASVVMLVLVGLPKLLILSASDDTFSVTAVDVDAWLLWKAVFVTLMRLVAEALMVFHKVDYGLFLFICE